MTIAISHPVLFQEADSAEDSEGAKDDEADGAGEAFGGKDPDGAGGGGLRAGRRWGRGPGDPQT